MIKKSNETISAALLRRLQRLSAPAWLIDVPRSRVVWTNQAGAKRLDPDGTGEPRGGWLDANMPAMQSIFNIHHGAAQASGTVSGKENREREHSRELIFQTPNGTLRQHCSISLFAPPAGNLALVICQDGGRAVNESKPAPPALSAAHQMPRTKRLYANVQRNGTAHANNNSPPAAAGTDARTLQEIARRIRETPVGNDASPFSLEALHAAASDRDPPPMISRPTLAPNALRREGATAGTSRPTIVNFRHAAKVLANKNKTLPAGRRATNASHTTDAEPADDRAAGHYNSGTNNGVDAKYSAKLAHELRTPISAIHSAADLLAREQFGPIGSKRYKGYALDIRQSAAHALSVIEAMLDPNAVASGTPRTEPIELDLTQLIKTTVSGIKPLTRTAKIKLVTRLHKNLPLVLADARAVRQILLNLLTNAIKHTPTGGRITITTSFENGGTARVKIQDTGPGMSQSSIRTILKNDGFTGAVPKQELKKQNSRSRPVAVRSTGHGFGLPLVMTLARANGAKFELSSKEDEGLNASLLFPTISVACVR